MGYYLVTPFQLLNKNMGANVIGSSDGKQKPAKSMNAGVSSNDASGTECFGEILVNRGWVPMEKGKKGNIARTIGQAPPAVFEEQLTPLEYSSSSSSPSLSPIFRLSGVIKPTEEPNMYQQQASGPRKTDEAWLVMNVPAMAAATELVNIEVVAPGEEPRRSKPAEDTSVAAMKTVSPSQAVLVEMFGRP